MSSDERDFIFKPFGGGRPVVKVLLSKRKGARRDEEEEAGPETPEYGILPGALPEDELARLTVPHIIFLDLGTRLREGPGPVPTDVTFTRVRTVGATEKPVGPTEDEPHGGWWNEYVESEFDELAQSPVTIDFEGTGGGAHADANTGTQGINAQLSKQKEFDERVLGSRARRKGDPDWRPADALDPLGTTKANGSKRVLPNCMALPYKMDYVPLDMILTKIVEEGEGETKNWPICDVARKPVSGLGDSRVTALPLNVKWKKRKAKPTKDALEIWNSVNLGGPNNQPNVAFESGYFDARKGVSGQYHLKIDSRLFYESFDTADVDKYKVTSEPFPEGDAVPFQLLPARGARIYLKPMWLALTIHQQFTARHGLRYESYRALRSTSDLNTNGPLPSVYTDYITRTAGWTNPFVLAQIFQSPGSFDIPRDWTAHALMEALDSAGCHGRATVSGNLSFSREYTAALDFYGICRNLQFGDTVNPQFSITGQAIVDGISVDMSGTTDYGPFWRMINASAVTTAIVPYGPFAFRIPVYLRPVNGSWSSAYDNTTGHPDLPGKQFGFSMSFALTRPQRHAFFTRRASWNLQQYVSHVYPATAQHTDQPKCTSAGHTDGYLITPADYSLILTNNAAAAAQLAACLGAQPKIRNSITTGPTSQLEEYTQSTVAFANGFEPSSKPAGLLCGVVVNAGKTYYIWRKEAQDLLRADYVRDNFNGSV